MVSWKAWSLFVLLWLASNELTFAQAPQNVLILYSYFDGMPWQKLVREGLSSTINSLPATERPAIFEENLDNTRIGKGGFGLLAPFLETKYSAIHFDKVISESAYAATFLREHSELFPTAQRYFINYGQGSWAPPKGTGLLIHEDFPTALLTITKVMPQLKNLVVILDQSLPGQQWDRQLEPILKAFKKEVHVSVWNNFAFSGLIENVKHLPPQTAIFYLPVFQDRLGHKTVPFDLAKQLAQASNAPIFVHHDSLLGSGVVGGYVLSGRNVGKVIGLIASHRGSRPFDLTEWRGGEFENTFDYLAVFQYDLESVKLPPDSVLLNPPVDVLKNYLWQIVGVLSLLVVETVLVLWLLVALRDRKKALGLLKVERELLETRVIERTHDLEMANQEKDKLFTVLAHDLRGPIGNFETLARLASESLEKPETAKTFLGSAERAGKQIHLLLENILDWISGQRDDPNNRREKCPVFQVFTTVSYWLASAAREKVVQVQIEVSETLVVLANQHVLEIVLRNLLSNAIKYSSSGCSVVLRGGEDEQGIWMEVQDRGLGMEPERINQLFQRVSSKHGTNGERGNGLGLMFCEDLLKKQNSHIEVESHLGQGSRFRIVVPQ